MDDELWGHEISEAPEWKVNVFDAIVVGATLVQGLAEAVVATAALTRRLCAGHANWIEKRRVFHEEAALGIEEIPTDEE